MVVVAPEDFQLAPGEVSSIDRASPPSPADAFHCAGCSRPECAAGCVGMAWREQAGGYLREVLTAKVYDVAVETPLQRADKLR